MGLHGPRTRIRGASQATPGATPGVEFKSGLDNWRGDSRSCPGSVALHGSTGGGDLPKAGKKFGKIQMNRKNPTFSIRALAGRAHAGQRLQTLAGRAAGALDTSSDTMQRASQWAANSTATSPSLAQRWLALRFIMRRNSPSHAGICAIGSPTVHNSGGRKFGVVRDELRRVRLLRSVAVCSVSAAHEVEHCPRT